MQNLSKERWMWNIRARKAENVRNSRKKVHMWFVQELVELEKRVLNLICGTCIIFYM